MFLVHLRLLSNPKELRYRKPRQNTDFKELMGNLYSPLGHS